MSKIYFSVIIFLFFAVTSIGRAQVGINTKNPESTFEIRKIDSYESYQGLLLPRLTEGEINTMTKSNPLPPEGLMVYNTTKQCVYIYKQLLGWRCVEFNKQSLAFEYIGESGTWMKGLTTTASNTVTFRVTNNLSIPISGQNLNNALTLPNVSGGAYTITPIRDYSSETFPAGQHRDYTYKITGYTPTTSGEALTVKFSLLEKEVSGNIIIKDQIGVQPIEILFNGDYMTNKKFDSNNTITLKIKNFTNTPYNNVDLSNAIHLNFPGGGIKIVSGQNSSVEIPSGEKSFTYQLEGTPLAPGVINASFVSNANVIGILSKSQAVSDLEASKVKVTEMIIKGVYIEGTDVNNLNYVNVTLKNDNNFALEHLNFSKALKINVGSGVSVVSDQHTDITIDANGTITLKYKLTGIPSGDELKATWNYGNFGAITKTEPIKIRLRVFPEFIAVDANKTDTSSVTVFAGGSNPWEIENRSSLPNWVTPNIESGTGDSSLTFTLTTHTTSEVKVAEVIIRRADGAIGKVIISKPATNELKIGRISDFSINGETKTITVSGDLVNTNFNFIQKPDWVETIKLNNPPGTLVITTMSRTTVGGAKTEPLSFSYGPGLSYIITKEITIKAKARLCPDTPFLPNAVPYLRSKYKNYTPTDQFLLATESGFSDFSTFSTEGHNSYFETKVVNGTTDSYFFLQYKAGKGYPYYENKFSWDYRVYLVTQSKVFQFQNPDYRSEKFEVTYFNFNSILREWKNNTAPIYRMVKTERDGKFTYYWYYGLKEIPESVLKACFCIDGYDENTPNKP